MTSIIYKYKLDPNDADLHTIKLHKGAKILSAGVIDEEIYVWVLLNLHKPIEYRRLRVCTTGYTFIEDDENSRFINTIIMKNKLVFHVFEVL